MDREPHVEHALAEIKLGELYGDADAIEAGEKRLAAAGHKRRAAAKENSEARGEAPKGRSSRPTTKA